MAAMLQDLKWFGKCVMPVGVLLLLTLFSACGSSSIPGRPGSAKTELVTNASQVNSTTKILFPEVSYRLITHRKGRKTHAFVVLAPPYDFDLQLPSINPVLHRP